MMSSQTKEKQNSQLPLLQRDDHNDIQDPLFIPKCSNVIKLQNDCLAYIEVCCIPMKLN